MCTCQLFINVCAIFIFADKSGAFWQKSLVLAVEAHQFIDVYGGISEQTKENQLILPVNVVNSVVSSICEYFKLHETIPKVVILKSFDCIC